MTKNKTALITGITGQDGSYLAELLLNKGYEVHGIFRRSSSFNTGRIEHLYDKKGKTFFLHYGDMTDSLSLDKIIKEVLPDEIYHLAAQSHVRASFDIPKYTADVDGVGTLALLDCMRRHVPKSKFYNAATSELFGLVQEVPQKETTPFYPRSPYGVAKLYSYWITKNYRESYNLFAVNGILFNHESPRRGDTFVTMKVVKGLVNYHKTGTPLYMGNLDAKRDWGYTKDFVYGMWLMLQQDTPEDFVMATGETHSIKEFINESLKHIPNNYKWAKDEEDRDILWDDDKNKLVIGIDPVYYRPAEVDLLLGDPSKAKEKLGWEAKTKFEDLVKIMMENELR